MAGKRHVLISAVFAAAVAFASAAHGAESADGQEPARKRPDWKLFRWSTPDSASFENMAKAMESLSPEQQKRLRENLLRWSSLSPEQKKALRARDAFRKARMAEEVQRAMREAGLQLDDARRAEFVKRYAEERRKIEEQLRKETDAKRKPMVKAVLEQLKQEFSTPAPAVAKPVIPDLPPTP